jgi:hypothetical protein
LVDSAIGGSGEEKIGGNCPPPHSNPSIDFEFGKISLTRQANSPPRANRRFDVNKRGHLFIRVHNETLSVIAVIPLPKCRMIRENSRRRSKSLDAIRRVSLESGKRSSPEPEERKIPRVRTCRQGVPAEGRL